MYTQQCQIKVSLDRAAFQLHCECEMIKHKMIRQDRNDTLSTLTGRRFPAAERGLSLQFYIQEAQLMLTTGSTRLAVSRGQQTWYHSTCYI